MCFPHTPSSKKQLIAVDGKCLQHAVLHEYVIELAKIVDSLCSSFDLGYSCSEFIAS